MLVKTKGSILQIVLLQSRQLGMGEANVLFEFQMMHDDLRAKRAQISHSEVPTKLLSNSYGSEGDKGDTEVGEVLTKKPRKANPNNWHPKLKEALAGPLTVAGNPTFTQLLTFCKTGS